MDSERKTVNDICRDILRESCKYEHEDGTPGPFCSEWGWRTIAKSLRKVAFKYAESEICSSCGSMVADFPSRLCQGCAAYNEHLSV